MGSQNKKELTKSVVEKKIKKEEEHSNKIDIESYNDSQIDIESYDDPSEIILKKKYINRIQNLLNARVFDESHQRVGFIGECIIYLILSENLLCYYSDILQNDCEKRIIWQGMNPY